MTQSTPALSRMQTVMANERGSYRLSAEADDHGMMLTILAAWAPTFHEVMDDLSLIGTEGRALVIREWNAAVKASGIGWHLITEGARNERARVLLAAIKRGAAAQ